MGRRRAQQNAPETALWAWTEPRRRAALLLAEDELTDDEIASELGVNRATLWRWKQHPEFAAQVAAHVAELGDAAARYAIARKRRRVKALDDRWRRLHQVIAERGAAMRGVPGGSTGLLVRRVKSVGTGPQQQIVEEYEVDGTLLREAREHEKAAAIELGQLDLPAGGGDPEFQQEE